LQPGVNHDSERSQGALEHLLRRNLGRLVGTYGINFSHANAADSHESAPPLDTRSVPKANAVGLLAPKCLHIE
jgi:hypothetical protein